MKIVRTSLTAGVALLIAAFQAVAGPLKPNLTTPVVELDRNSAHHRISNMPTLNSKTPKAKKAPAPAVASEIVMNLETGAVVFERNADQPRDPSSLTKLATAYAVMLAVKQGRMNLDQQITVGEGASQLKNNSFKAVNSTDPDEAEKIPAGSKLTAREALAAGITSSANGIMRALAEATPIKRNKQGKWVPGTEAEFAKYITHMAQYDMGMSNTHFVNASGLNDVGADGRINQSTARDLAVLTYRLAHDFPEFEKLIALHNATAKLTLPNGVKKAVTGSSTNRFVVDYAKGSPQAEQVGFFAVGPQKTGTNHLTDAINLIATAENAQGVRLTSIVLGAKSSDVRYTETLSNFKEGYQILRQEGTAPELKAPYVRAAVREVSAVSSVVVSDLPTVRNLRDAQGKAYPVKSDIVMPRVSPADYDRIWKQQSVSAAKPENLEPTLAALKTLGFSFYGKAPTDFNNARMKQAIAAFKVQTGLPNPEKGEFDTVTQQYLKQAAARAQTLITQQQSQDKLGGTDLRGLARLKADHPDRVAQHDHILAIKEQLAKQGLLKPPVDVKFVPGERKGQRVRVETPQPFTDSLDGRLFAALATFQESQGLKNTRGMVDGVTLAKLNVTPSAPAPTRAFDNAIKPRPIAVAPAVMPAAAPAPAPVRPAAPQAPVQKQQNELHYVTTVPPAIPVGAPIHKNSNTYDRRVKLCQTLLECMGGKFRELLGAHGADGFYGEDTEKALQAYAEFRGIDRKPGELSRELQVAMQEDQRKIAKAALDGSPVTLFNGNAAKPEEAISLDRLLRREGEPAKLTFPRRSAAELS